MSPGWRQDVDSSGRFASSCSFISRTVESGRKTSISASELISPARTAWQEDNERPRQSRFQENDPSLQWTKVSKKILDDSVLKCWICCHRNCGSCWLTCQSIPLQLRWSLQHLVCHGRSRQKITYYKHDLNPIFCIIANLSSFSLISRYNGIPFVPESAMFSVSAGLCCPFQGAPGLRPPNPTRRVRVSCNLLQNHNWGRGRGEWGVLQITHHCATS